MMLAGDNLSFLIYVARFVSISKYLTDFFLSTNMVYILSDFSWRMA